MANPHPHFYKYKASILSVNGLQFPVHLAVVAESQAKLCPLHASTLCVFLKGFWSGKHMADSNLHFNYTAQLIGRYLSHCRWRPRALTPRQSRCDSAFRQLSQRAVLRGLHPPVSIMSASVCFQVGYQPLCVRGGAFMLTLLTCSENVTLFRKH